MNTKTDTNTSASPRPWRNEPSGRVAAAHSFPAHYHLTGNRTEQVKQIGNSVPCRTAAAICAAALGGIAS